MPLPLIGYLVSNEPTNGCSSGGEGLTAHSRFLSSDRTTQSNPRERNPQWFPLFALVVKPEIIVDGADLQGGFERVDPRIICKRVEEAASGLFGPWLLLRRSATTERTHPLPSSSLSSFPKTEDGSDDSRIGRHSQMNADEASGLLSLSRLEDRQRNLLFIELSRGIRATHPPACGGDRNSRRGSHFAREIGIETATVARLPLMQFATVDGADLHRNSRRDPSDQMGHGTSEGGGGIPTTGGAFCQCTCVPPFVRHLSVSSCLRDRSGFLR